MIELESKLATLEGKLNDFVGTLKGEVESMKGEIQTLDEGALAALETCLSEVEGVRAFLLEQLGKVEARATALRPG
ncbi:MAG: hypothetical protein JKY65_04915 [Planctomycetes bacterium]|nr:hypothetical protein [Planctomycetota bacterium]